MHNRSSCIPQVQLLWTIYTASVMVNGSFTCRVWYGYILPPVMPSDVSYTMDHYMDIVDTFAHLLGKSLPFVIPSRLTVRLLPILNVLWTLRHTDGYCFDKIIISKSMVWDWETHCKQGKGIVLKNDSYSELYLGFDTLLEPVWGYKEHSFIPANDKSST